MLARWTELLPLFVVRWLALRRCERVSITREGHDRQAAVARPDVLIRVPPAPVKIAEKKPLSYRDR